MKFYYKPLETRPDEKVTVCPVCGEEIACHIWQHVQSPNNEKTHAKFVEEQLDICRELFYNYWYTGKQCIKGFYMSYKGVGKCWDKWYDKQALRKRGYATDWEFIKENSYYDESFKIEKGTVVCPACGEVHSDEKGLGSLFTHMAKHWRDETHYNLLLPIVGEMLHREKWDENCWYHFDAFYYVTKLLKGRDYVANHQLRDYKVVDSKVDWDKIRKEQYYDGDVEFEECDGKVVCPACSDLFTKKAIMNHVMKSWKDSKHYDLILRFVGMVVHNQMFHGEYISGGLLSEVKQLMSYSSQLEKSKDLRNSFVPEIPADASNFYYKVLEEVEENDHVCPVCGKKVRSVLRHATLSGHDEFLTSQFKMASELFFNQWFDKSKTLKGYYLNYFDEKLWGKWFGKLAKTRSKINNANWEEIVERAYVDDNMHFEYVCPACGANCLHDSKNLIMSHIWSKWRDEKHYDLLLRIVGDMLSRNYWDETCSYPRESYLFVIEKIKGSEYVKELKKRNRKLKGRNSNKGYRTDLGFSVNSSWEANIHRLFRYKLGEWNPVLGVDREIPFDISSDGCDKTYYVDLYDKHGVICKDAYLEIKGYFGPDAEFKKKMFEKLYPDKKYVVIGQESEGFVPNVDYNELYEKYVNVIPNWEKKSDSFAVCEKGASGERKDVGFAANFREANLFRIFKKEYGKDWRRLVEKREFDIQFNGEKYELVVDNGNLFGCCVAIQEEFDYHDMFCIARIKELYGNLIVIGDRKYDDVLYSKLEAKYRHLKLWETKEKNFSTHHRKFMKIERKKRKKLKQTLGKEYVDSKIELLSYDFGREATPSKFVMSGNKCPSCGEDLGRCSCWQHAVTNYDTHKEFLDDQCRVMNELFFDLTFKNDDDCSRYNLHISEHNCMSYWKRAFSDKLIQKRRKLLRQCTKH